MDRKNARPDAIQVLLDAIGAGDDAAAESASQLFAERADLIPGLRPLLADADPDRRWWAVRALALTHGEAAMPLLAGRLSDTDEATRCAAALGLGELRAVDAIPALIARLADESGWVRDSAADGLALMGDPALPALVAALADPRDGVRVRAAGALRRAFVSLYQTAPQLSTLPRAHAAAITALFRALNDPNRLVRHSAYEALDRMGFLETVFLSP